ncbi:MAG: sigma-70 family RNA polymerase sigma factor [Deltaproteobacteria bacterium]|nr:sigma-70 family RNA polymerase sigma factor [Deltaproteobacteria bacterium]
MGLPVLADSLHSYLAEINRYPLLSQDEEFEIAERYCRSKSIGDAHMLVASNLRYVVKIALGYRNYGCRIADLIQEGNIGLMIAVKKFNPYKGFRLITYATWWIRSCIQEFILKTSGIVKRGAKALKRKLFYRTESRADTHEPKDDGLMAGSDDVMGANDLSLNISVGDELTTRQDMLADSGPGPLEATAIREEEAIVKREVKDALALLNGRERMVIEKRILSEEPESLQDIGDELGVTRERVRQIEAEAVKKLRKSLASTGLTDLLQGA